MPAIKDWLASASRRLSEVIVPSPNLDAEVILAHAIQKNRTYLHAHPEQTVDSAQLKTANNMLSQRIKRVPVAYIIGYKEFYGRNFIVNPSVLIPRPESETIIDILKKILHPISHFPNPNPHLTEILPPISHFPNPNPHLIDIGTGSGNLGITAKLEFPNLDVTITDISADALSVATLNASVLQADILVLQSDLLQNYTEKADIIIANLPYVDKVWERSTETNYEPDLALFANKHGLDLIEKLITQSTGCLLPGGYMILEADPEQHETIIKFAGKNSLNFVSKLGYAITFVKTASDLSTDK